MRLQSLVCAVRFAKRRAFLEERGMEDNQSAELMARWRDGDQQAAAALFQRHAERLLALVRTRLSGQLTRRFDPEDVVQSAYRSFFIGARDGRYVLTQSGDLWRLMVSITLHKLYSQVEHHQAAKRAPDREADVQDAGGLTAFEAETLARDPSPAEAAALTDELEQLMRGLDLHQRRIFELRLQGYTLEEIATETRHSLRTVRRRLEQIKQRLEQRDREHSGS